MHEDRARGRDSSDLDEQQVLASVEPAARAVELLGELAAVPARTDEPHRTWLVSTAEVTCTWCGRAASSMVGRIEEGPDGGLEVVGNGAHVACEQQHFAHGVRVARVLARVLDRRPRPLAVWARVEAQITCGPSARAWAADMVASDGVFFLPAQAGYRLLPVPEECLRCTLPCWAEVHLEGVSVAGPQHFDCCEARLYQGLGVTTLADELYPDLR